MTRRNKPKNKTIVKKSFSISDVPADVRVVWAIQYSGQPVGMKMFERIKEITAKYPEWFDEDDDNFIFPNDLDSIQPIQKDGNLCIQFPE